MPTQVLVSNTPALRSFLAECIAESAKEHIDAEAVDMDEIYRLVDEHQKKGGEPPMLNKLLEGSEVVEQIAPAPADLTELEKLRLQSEERAYQRSVDGVVKTSDAALKRSKEPDASAKNAFGFATNFATQTMVAFIGAFLLGYYFVETFVAPENFDAKVIAGAACSFVTLLLETCLLVVHESKESMVQTKREKVEKGREKRQSHAARAADNAADTATPHRDEIAEKPKDPAEKKTD